ncbi:MAG TPA: aminotransferase class V-fold PLP-dependent enzyme [Opitutaceae bacterium]|nr:aminotransferase class V-fold PLP-dependent enzyme [Opitutaceae bacterium]
MAYFDYNATAPLLPLAREVWLTSHDDAWQNPSSPYRGAARARAKLEQTREALARILGCAGDSIVFTSGSTEAAYFIFAYLAQALAAQEKIAVNSTEHPCVLAAAERFFPGRIVWLTPIEGVVSPAYVRTLLASGGIGTVVLMAANNETGILQPWADVLKACKEARVPFVCDATQWLGKLPSARLGESDWMFGAAHKLGGPKGVGFLKIPVQARGFRGLVGGEQEHNHRAGTENLPGAMAMLAALSDAEEHKVLLETERLRWRRDFEQRLRTLISGIKIVGENHERLWNTVSLLLPQHENHRWVAKLDQLGFQVSTGSACASGRQAPSHVLAAMGFVPEEARRVVRVSSGWETTEQDWQALAEAFAKADANLRASASVDVVKI